MPEHDIKTLQNTSCIYPESQVQVGLSTDPFSNVALILALFLRIHHFPDNDSILLINSQVVTLFYGFLKEDERCLKIRDTETETGTSGLLREV